MYYIRYFFFNRCSMSVVNVIKCIFQCRCGNNIPYDHMSVKQ